MSESKSKAEIIAEYINILKWPSIVVLVLVLFWSPLNRSAQQLPEVISRANAISFGDFKLQLNNSLKNELTPEVKDILGELDSESIDQLLNFEYARCFTDSVDFQINLKLNEHLIANGLVEEVNDVEVVKKECILLPDNSYSHAIRPTQLGKETRDYLLLMISNLIKS